MRLAVPAVTVWGASVAGLWLIPAALAVLCALLAGAAACMLCFLRGRGPRGRSFLATGAVALLLAVAAAAHSSAAAGQRFDGPVADAVAAKRTAVALVEIAGPPRALVNPGAAADRAGEAAAEAGPAAYSETVTPGRWAVPVWTRELTAGSTLIRTRARLVVIGGGGWGAVVPGQVFRVAGTLRPAEPGQVEAGILAASAVMPPAGAGTGLQGAARDLRTRFVAAAAFLAPDPRGLLPGMVTGDTTALDSGLESAMQMVGMTHLTAVSGANCSLVLGALLFACRGARLPRVPAAAGALAGLGLFVVLVGPDASVLRAALMGAVAVAALAGGRTGRGLSFLCVAVIGLLLSDPALGSSVGFLLSVLATLGIIVLGRRIIEATPHWVPRWAAALVAVPLSAQLLCGPVIVLLQPQFATYSLPANVVAAPLVAPVTLLGTAAVPLVALAPWLAAALIGVSGTFCGVVAAVARGAARLPGAALPWPEGPAGMATMVLLSALTYSLLAAALRPAAAARLVVRAHRRTERLLENLEHTVASIGGPRGLDAARGHGRLDYSTALSGRNPRWPLRKSVQPVRRRRTRLPGGTLPRPPSSWSVARKTTWPPGRWTASAPKSGPRTRRWR
ncbi:ComEC/Rec2 family competence protein [Pseudarthrobacter sp. NPDC092439]|uniref:ComEC/Rec2 family competence protein n=1 Tax=unclassified Pseudarthrobacter TaxID=2647000 RepID=UPI0037F3A49D